MKQEIERTNRISNPEHTTGLDQEKVRQAAADISFRAGQVGRTKLSFEAQLWRVL